MSPASLQTPASYGDINFYNFLLALGGLQRTDNHLIAAAGNGHIAFYDQFVSRLEPKVEHLHAAAAGGHVKLIIHLIDTHHLKPDLQTAALLKQAQWNPQIEKLGKNK